MIALQRFIRLTFPYNKAPCSSTLVLRQLATKSDDGDNGDNASSNKQQAIDKLNALLKKMVEEDVVQTEKRIELARPKGRKNVNEPLTEGEIKTKKTVGDQIVHAVQNVAKGIGGNAKQTESELLSKLLNSTNEQQKAPSSLSDIVRGMKVDRESKGSEEMSRAKQIKMLIQSAKDKEEQRFQHPQSRTRRKPRQDNLVETIEVKKIDLFGAEPLNIFEAEKLPEPVQNQNATWQALHDRELRLAVTHPPANYFQEMILWTEQGKLWKFPIDNEQDIGAEKDVYFTEHVFLDKYLEPWCPTKGPIRHFMELVCVGLSKNPYLSVKDKREHIEWYRDYFNEKKQLLMDVEALPAAHKEKQLTADK